MEHALIQASELADAPLEQVWARLDLVMDPELDEPVTDMGFIETVSITGPGEVSVSFRLPTYWCSPNFAFLMAEGIKREVEALPWVVRAVVTLQDHMAAEEMNAAINSGASFGSVFADLHPGEDLSALREKFDQKAFQRRQEVVIKALRAQGYSPEDVVAMSLVDFAMIGFDDAEAARQRDRYMALLLAKSLAANPGDRAFPTYQGAPIAAEGFTTYMGLLRSVRINMEFSGSLCRGLKASRYKQADLTGEVPILVDFAQSDLPSQTCR
jgi:metal-sulfur cluster biosynthetic enzyme